MQYLFNGFVSFWGNVLGDCAPPDDFMWLLAFISVVLTIKIMIEVPYCVLLSFMKRKRK